MPEHQPAEGAATTLPLVLPLLIALAGYLAGVLAARRRGRPWPVRRTLAGCAGLAAAATAVVGPVATAAEHDFTAHMIGHLLLGMLAPLLLVLAAPVTLALRALPAKPARRVARLARCAPVRALTHPFVAGPLSAGGLWLLYTTPLYASMATDERLHLAVHAHLLITGYLFTAAIIGVDPAPHRSGFTTRAVAVVAFVAAHDILAKHLYAHPPPGLTGGRTELAAMVMYYGGDLIDLALIVVFCWQWYAAAARSRPAVGAPGSPGRVPAG